MKIPFSPPDITETEIEQVVVYVVARKQLLNIIQTIKKEKV